MIGDRAIYHGNTGFRVSGIRLQPETGVTVSGETERSAHRVQTLASEDLA